MHPDFVLPGWAALGDGSGGPTVNVYETCHASICGSPNPGRFLVVVCGLNVFVCACVCLSLVVRPPHFSPTRLGSLIN